jgi:hypothetical protein
MKRLLQRIEDGVYYQGRGAWTRHAHLACNFPSTSAALVCCARQHLAGMQVVLRFEASAFDVRFPCFHTEEEVLPAHPRSTHRPRKIS